MARSRFRRMSAAVVVGALIGGMPWAAAAATTGESTAAPGISVCVFYGICVGPPLPGR